MVPHAEKLDLDFTRVAVTKSLRFALSPALQAASVMSNVAIAVCFSPEEDCAAFAVRAIDNAEREILVSAYGLTTGSGIVEASVRAIPQAEWRWLRDR